MADTLTIVNRFLEATNLHKDLQATARLITADVKFSGPVIQTSGAGAYLSLLEQFLPTHVETRMIRQFEDGDEVCSIYDLVQRTPQGGTITLNVADWVRVSQGRIAEQRIYYDPREFTRAFGL